MPVQPLLRSILRDEALTRGLADPEARLLVDWLAEQADRLDAARATEESARGALGRLCRRARAIGRFVSLWCYARERGPALQLAAAERLAGPLPCQAADPCELMHQILTSEAAAFAA
jgi:hypothetical protein